MDIDAWIKNPGSYISNSNESKLKFLQVVSSTRTRTNASTGACEKQQTSGFMLDGSDPYGSPNAPAVGTIQITSEPNVRMDDSPAQPLATGSNFTVSDSFRVYLVYFTGTNAQPANQKAIALLEWAWSGATTYNPQNSSHAAVPNSIFPANQMNVYGAKLTPSNDGTGIGSYSTTTIQSFAANPANWVACQ